MDAVLQWGLDFIRAVQSYSNPPLTVFMRIITSFGSATAYIILLPFIYWCVDEKKGLRLGLAVLVSVWINISLKFLFDQPRPFFEGYDLSVGLVAERLGGFPSGHAQNSLVLWIIIASWGKRKRFYGIAAIFCLLIGFSRIYLGVHFPTDILGGWILGSLVLAAYFLLVRQLEDQTDDESGKSSLKKLLEQGGLRLELIIMALTAFVMILYRPDEETIIPGGVLFGMAAGYILNKRYIGFKNFSMLSAAGVQEYVSAFFRFLPGIASAFLIFEILGKIIPKNQFADHYLILYFLRFVITSLWIYAGAPWFFRVLPLPNGKEEA
ncbi:MAG: phosphatase PAP2 family protein [Treponema sp.]|jgi:membrane-associated phospholipid phosphatase|nr:phosphatase PAP2 family protein [Treponema sp.]